VIKDQNDYSGLRAMQVQLSRLFGAASRHSTTYKPTDAQWRTTLRSVLKEIEAYLVANVDTDEFHMHMIFTGIAGAREALREDDFWPGYIEGITRITFLLLGDYPDHRRRKRGRKDADFYRLNQARTAQWVQTPEQRFRTLMDAGAAGFPILSKQPLDVLREFRGAYGFKPKYTEFLEWYRRKFSEDYAAVFR
jgi:hypothetical protein